jgi:DNA-binding NtrC family response regulator
MERTMSDVKNQHEEYIHNETMKTILLVEDDAIISELLTQMIMQETPYQICLASDGLEALNLVKNMKPQLLILDYWLPFMQGIEVYDILHGTEGLEEVPAIMLSVHAPVQEINKRHMAYIRKPFDITKLLDTINRLLVS